MTSVAAGFVKAALRIYTLRYRVRQASLSRNVKYRYKAYRVPKGYSYEVTEYNGVKVEKLTPEKVLGNKIILQIHGGGAVGGMTATYRKAAERYAAVGGLKVFSIDYSAGADRVHPELLNECCAAFDGLTAAGYAAEDFIIAGDSFGANMALALCLKRRDEGKALPIAVISVCVQADMASTGDSYRKNAYADPMYALPFWQSYEKRGMRLRRISPYCGKTDLTDPYLSPAYGDFKGFPALFIQCGDVEMGESDSDMIYCRAVAAGVDVTYKKYRGMFHDFHYFAPRLPESRKAWQDLGDFIAKVNKEK